MASQKTFSRSSIGAPCPAHLAVRSLAVSARRRCAPPSIQTDRAPGPVVTDGPGWQGFLQSIGSAMGGISARLDGKLPPLPTDGSTPDDTNNADITLSIALDSVRFRVRGIGFGGDWSVEVELGEIVGAPDHYPLIVESISNPEDSVNKFRLLLWPNYSI
jgi:hypothetical protein